MEPMERSIALTLQRCIGRNLLRRLVTGGPCRCSLRRLLHPNHHRSILLQRENLVLLGLRNDSAVEALVRARSMPGRPVPDPLIVATARESGVHPLATFDGELRRYGIAVRSP